MAKQDKPNSGRPGPNKGSFADQLKSLQGSAEPAAKPAVKPAAMPLASRTIQDPKRAGRAPYNFVPPLDEQWCQVEPPPPLDQEHPDLLSGVIELDYEALTRFYLRGMYTLEKGPGAKPPTEPFLIDKQLRLPGPSLRGMLRTLVEIIGKAPLDPVNNDLLFFRAIASTGGESNSPEARAYKEQLGTELSNVKAGFLYGNANPRSWYIQPAQKLPGGEKWARLFTDETWKRGEAHFRCVPGKYGLRGVLCSPSDPGAIHGWKVCSGPPPPLPSHKKRYYSNGEEDKRRHQWLIPS